MAARHLPMTEPLFHQHHRNPHPEKFHKRLVDYIDLSQTNESLVDAIFEILFELELLCTECIAYESFVEWKVK